MIPQNNNQPQIIRVYRTQGMTHIVLKILSGLLIKTSNQLIKLSNYIDSVDLTKEKYKAIIMRNKVLENCHRGRRCFIIGNGPSLTTQDISYLKNELTFVVSGFYKHPIVNQWQPKYYCFADPVFYDGSEQMQKFFMDLNDHIYSSTFIVPLPGMEIFLGKYQLPKERTYFILPKGKLANRLKRLPDFCKAIPGVLNSAQLPIMAAMYMGCSPIYLIGLDHDWMTHRNMDRHFYSETTVSGHPVATGRTDVISYQSDLAGNLDVWNGYINLKKVADQHNIQIINATKGGFLDVFPRVSYETLFP